jgi:hypothetical protein
VAVGLFALWTLCACGAREVGVINHFLAPSSTHSFLLIAMMFAKVHPLLIPEIVLLVSRLVARKDAVTCARVCKTWNDHFTSTLWHTIDFGVQTKLASFNTAIKKHGHRIRAVNGIDRFRYLIALRQRTVCKLSSLNVLLLSRHGFQEHCGDLLSPSWI